MRIVCLAYQIIGHAALRYFLEESGDEVVALITHEDSPGEEVWWPSAPDLAAEYGVPVYSPDDINAPESVELLAHLSPDFLISAWYRQLLKQQALATASRGGLNLHGSLLPRYRGRAPVNWVLVNGETETGMTLHYMVPRADAGDVVGQVRVPISEGDTALSLYHRLAAATVEVLRGTWPAVASGQAARMPQDESQATYVGRRTPRDGLFRWDWPARRIHNLVRAVTHPYPGAFFEGRRGAGSCGPPGIEADGGSSGDRHERRAMPRSPRAARCGFSRPRSRAMARRRRLRPQVRARAGRNDNSTEAV